MQDWNEDGRNEPEALIWGWICWVWLWREQPWITNWAHLSRLTQTPVPTTAQSPFPGESSIPQSSGAAKPAGNPFLQGLCWVRAAPKAPKVPRAPLSIQQALNISSSTMNCGFSGLIHVAAATLGQGEVNVLFMLKWRRGARGVPGRLENGIILNKLLMVLKALLIDYRLCS